MGDKKSIKVLLKTPLKKPEFLLIGATFLVITVGVSYLDINLVIMALVMGISVVVPLGFTTNQFLQKIFPHLCISFVFGLLFLVSALRPLFMGIFVWQVLVLLIASALSLLAAYKLILIELKK